MSKKKPLTKSQPKKAPKLVKNGKEVKMPSEAQTLETKKAHLLEQVAEIDEQLAAIKKEKADALIAELKALGIDVNATRPTRTKTKGSRVCKLCGETGHNSRTCPKKVTPAQ